MSREPPENRRPALATLIGGAGGLVAGIVVFLALVYFAPLVIHEGPSVSEGRVVMSLKRFGSGLAFHSAASLACCGRG